ncbi:RNA-binding S4 domain-containing protein [Brevundimonas sp. 2R-24]|uniref:RNA-binding S4 domain-containing protein n=1 Tax=Peiella sedimenti TaxID=3061083 RepID=A0ABT8SNX9_9CAUL|nr:RNA-binding S4 domain-containing protein [Caulobacteraceae bacterium XZ-24]
MSPSPPAETCRIDVWLWRARFFKTRAEAARFVETARPRRLRHGSEARLDKPSRSVQPQDRLVFARAGRLIDVQVIACGVRRGPPAEARALYLSTEEPTA